MNRLTYSVREVSELTGQSKVYIYNLIKTGFFQPGELVEIKTPAKKSHYLINVRGLERLTGIRTDLN